MINSKNQILANVNDILTTSTNPNEWEQFTSKEQGLSFLLNCLDEENQDGFLFPFPDKNIDFFDFSPIEYNNGQKSYKGLKKGDVKFYPQIKKVFNEKLQTSKGRL